MAGAERRDITKKPGRVSNTLQPSWIENDYDDHVWRFRTSDGAVRGINFLTVPDRYRLFSKMFLSAVERFTDARAGFVVTSTRTYLRYFVELRLFLKACERLGIHRLMDIGEDTLDRIIAIRVEKYVARGKSMSQGSTTMIEALYTRLYILGPGRFGVLYDGLAFQPSALLPQKLSVRAVGCTAILPDDVAQRLFSEAIRFLSYAPAIIECARVETEAPPQTATDYDAARYLRLKFFARRDVLDRLKPHLDKLRDLSFPGVRKKPGAVSAEAKDGQSTLQMMSPLRLKRYRKSLVSACYVVVAGFTGFRLTEILTMEHGDVFTRNGHVVTRTRITKTSGRPEGSKVERPAIPIVLEAFSIVENLAGLYEATHKKAWRSDTQGLLTCIALNASVNTFMREVVGESDWHFTAHQLRRYFAIHYIRRFKGSSDALSYHFRHISQHMIETYIRDRGGAAYLLSAKKALAYELGGDLLYGRGNYAAKENLPLIAADKRYRAANLPLSKMEQRISELLDGLVDIHPTAFGYCLVQRKDSEGAVCGARDGIPNATEVHPGNCGACRYLVVGREQIPFWRHTIELHERVLDSPVSLPLLKKASETMIAKGRALLSRFEDAKADGDGRGESSAA